VNKNTYKTLLFALVGLTALLCIIGVAIALGAISVLYRPEDITTSPSSLDPTLTWSSTPSSGSWATSSANSRSTTHTTLVYNNGKVDFILWAPVTFNKIPQNTPFYIYVNISQIAIPQGGGTTVFMLAYSPSGSSPRGINHARVLWANATHLTAKSITWTNGDTLQNTVNALDTSGSVINRTKFDPSKQLVIVIYANSGTDANNPYIYWIEVIQSGNILMKININSNLGAYTYVIPVTKYQMTIADMFVSYTAPDVLLQTSTTTTTTSTIPTLTVYALDSYTGKTATGSVYLNGTLVGQTGQKITLSTVNPNATQTIKISASGYYDYSFTARISGNLTAYVFLTPVSQPSEKVQVTFYTYDAITGNRINGTVSSGFNAFTSGKPYNLTKGYYTFTASAQGYKSLTFSVYISSNTVIPIYLYPASANTTTSGSVGYRPANTTTISKPDPQTYTGDYVGFHFINPSNASVTVSVYASIQGIVDTYHVLVETFNLPAYSDAYKSYNLRDVALKAGVLNIITPNPSAYKFTIMANNARIATISGDVAYQKYADLYVARGQGFTAMWGSGLQSPFTGASDWGQLLGALMPILIIALIFGLIEGVMPSGKKK